MARQAPTSLSRPRSTRGSLAAQIQGLNGGSYHFSAICITRSPDPGNSLSPSALLMRQPLTTNLVGSVKQGYTAIQVVKDTLASYLSPFLAPSWKSRPLLPTKPCRTTSAQDEIPLGRHRMVSAFMCGIRRLRSVRPIGVPSWDLSVVLEGLMGAPFEPLESAPERILTLKVTLLLALTSLKRVGNLQALSVSEMCMDFAPVLVKMTLRPRPGYAPKVLSASFHSQVVTLHSFHPPPFASDEDKRLHMLCSVQTLKIYVEKIWRKSPQLLVCFGAGRRGLATSKHRSSH